MDSLVKKDELSEAYERYVAFNRYKKDGSQKMDDFILEFVPNRRKCSYPKAVLAFKPLDAAQVEQKDRQVVLTRVDYSEKTALFDQMKSSLRKFFGEHGCNSEDSFRAVRIKDESINIWQVGILKDVVSIEVVVILVFAVDKILFLTSQLQMKLMVNKEELMEAILALVLLLRKGHHLTHVM